MATLDRLAPPTTAPVAPAWKPRRAIVVALTAVAAIALLQVLQSSSVAHTGQTMQRLQRDQATLQAEIHQLEAEVAALSSLDRIERTARDRLGMIPAPSVSYVAVQEEAPSGPLLPRPLLQLSEESQVRSESLLDSLLRALPLP